MTLNQILYFQKVARLENYHQAAEELYISQPSLSRSMAALESELGVALFEKKGRGVTLTKAGKLFWNMRTGSRQTVMWRSARCRSFLRMAERLISVIFFRLRGIIFHIKYENF